MQLLKENDDILLGPIGILKILMYAIIMDGDVKESTRTLQKLNGAAELNILDKRAIQDDQK